MNKKISYCVIGLGQTGLSCVRFLVEQGFSVVVMDTRDSPPNLSVFTKQFPNVPVMLGKNWSQPMLNQVETIVVSPGISIKLPAIEEAREHGAQIIGDIELFARFNQTPVIAITGANGKSTVTTLVGEMALNAGKNVAVVGNIGTPVLDILIGKKANYDLIVMELSSFQLETTTSLSPLVATVLNITPDHMDRYDSLDDYVRAKHRIYHRAKHVVINKQDPLTESKTILPHAQRTYFTLEKPLANEFGLIQKEGQDWLAWGEEALISASALKLSGKHNLANALSALALGQAAGLSMAAMLKTLQTFEGLAHRCQWVAKHNDILWINDSKGTNIGACQAALQGLGESLPSPGKIVILLGGDGKGADFKELSAMVKKYCRAIVVMGKATQDILMALDKIVPCYVATSMDEAVQLAFAQALPHDMVLLSPACSSLDQYRDFSHRGEMFTLAVNTLLGHHANAS